MERVLRMKPSVTLESLIHEIRGEKVIFDSDLARIYGVATRVLNQAVKRNQERFPEDFMFSLTRDEIKSMSQSVISLARLKFSKEVRAFTEHGALMAANVLNSAEAVKMSVHIVRAFIKQRELIASQAEILKKLAQMDAKLLKHDEALRMIWRDLQPLLTPASQSPKPEIGFHVREEGSPYKASKKKEHRI